MMGQDEGPRRELLAGGIYGTIVYLSVLVLVEEAGRTPRQAAGILVAVAVVFWLAHVYAHLVPLIAAEGRLRARALSEAARGQLGILVAVLVPVAPLVLAIGGVLDDATAVRAAFRAGLAALALFAVREARLAGLGWARTIVVAAFLVAAGVGLLALELALH